MDNEDVLYIAVAGVSLILVFHFMNSASAKSGPPVNGNKAHPPAAAGQTGGTFSYGDAKSLAAGATAAWDSIFSGTSSDSGTGAPTDPENGGEPDFSGMTWGGDDAGDNIDDDAGWT